jgi:putative chitinase
MSKLEDMELSLYALRRRLFDEFQMAKAAQDTAMMRQLEAAAGEIDDDLDALAIDQLQRLANRLTTHARKVHALTRRVSAWPFGNAAIKPPVETPPATTPPANTPVVAASPATTTPTGGLPATASSTTPANATTTPMIPVVTTRPLTTQPTPPVTGMATDPASAISAQQFARIFPTAPNPDEWASAISAAWKLFDITSRNARAGFLGITGNETGGYVSVRRERMNYTPERAVEVWPGKAGDASGRPTGTCRARCGAGEEAFANWIYAGILGNGDEASGDGWRFRGGGIIQLTGRSNYRACGAGMGLPQLEDKPQAVTDNAQASAAAAAWFMVRHARILDMLDSNSETDFLAAARRVGLPPDASAVQRRLDYRRKALAIL